MTEFLNPELIESVLSTVFDYFKKRVVTTPSDRANFDFVLKNDDGKKVAIEVTSQNLNAGQFRKISNSLNHITGIDEFILITPKKPSKGEIEFFDKFLRSKFANSSWLSLPDFLKNYYNLEINSKDDLVQLQIAAITSKIENYSKAHIGNQIGDQPGTEALVKSLFETKKGGAKYASDFISLRRQFSDSILATLSQESERLHQELFIGQKYADAIIVLTDIKNFSSIVTAADPDDLNEAMSKYYNNARDLVFKYNGILDKFIGDAVLAIFNYPTKTVESYLNTIKFCSELILLGKETFENLLSKMDQSVETGTRVGVSNGPIYTLNIGKGDIEVTFIGDKINFAARLEKNCDINGILLSNKFFTKLSLEFSSLIEQLVILGKDLDPADAKGQTMITKSWQISFDDITKINDYETT
jgi:adenylate cyclase